jgi:signal transduction histidine kinase
MLNSLRLRLTLLYLSAAIILVGILGFSSYSLLDFYFTRSNDAALQYKMASTFASIGLPLPSELQTSVLEWQGHNEESENEVNLSAEESNNEEKVEVLKTVSSSLTYEGELSSIFILPLDKDGNLVINPNPFTPPMDADKDSFITALKKGTDQRNGKLRDGTPVRLLTYSIPSGTGFSVLQMGKPVADQQRLMNQFLTGMAVTGGLIVILMGIGSWWVAGRSLLPAQKAWEMQQSFIANASHELRTPLTLIRAGSEVVMRQTAPNSRQKELLQDITTECDHMSQIVEDLLLISKLDTHQLKMDIVELDMAAILGDVLRQFTPLAEKKGVILKQSVSRGKVTGDPFRIRQVLIILMDNALRYTPPGGWIDLSAAPVGRMIQIKISDNGSGIPAEHLDHVFERFYQVETGKNSENRGNGLGLSIAKSLVEAHDGTIQITSQVGEGTRVTITLPAVRKIP